jgi:hypothetical protein
MENSTISNGFSSGNGERDCLDGRGSGGSFSYPFLDEFLLSLFLPCDKSIDDLRQVGEFGPDFKKGKVIFGKADGSAFGLWGSGRSGTRD